MTKSAKRAPRPPMTSKIVIGGLGLTLVTLTILIVRGLHGGSTEDPLGTAAPGRTGLAAARGGASLPGADPSLPGTGSPSGSATAISGDDPALRVPTPIPPEPQPWESTPGNTPPLPKGFEPAYAVNPTRDRPVVPPAPVEPSNPIVDHPPALNPGGVEGKRGPVPDEIRRRHANDRAAAGQQPDPGEARPRLHPDN